MKKVILSLIIAGLIFSCKESKEQAKPSQVEEPDFVGHWDNFQQYWLENTETDMHRVETEDKHKHLSLGISKNESGQFVMEVRQGRNGKELIETQRLTEDILNNEAFKISGDTLFVTGMKHFENKDPYKFIRTRKFSGWIEMPMPQYPDSIYRKSQLEIHDQGGMAEIELEGEIYTAELTQLLFGKKLAIMKLAIYDMPLDSVEINSRSISYTWLNPSAKRTGINLRKVTTGWTFIEPGYVNSDNTKFDKK